MENSQLATQSSSELISNLVLNGDISKMSNEMKVEYYNKLCHSLNLNPVTKPFQIISFQGKTILYATKDCTEQLRKINKVSIVELNQDIKEGLCISKCKVQDKDNRYDIATGCVNIAGLKGDALANAIMKSETKAKRRATLSICGLGILDESELDTMPTYTTADITQLTAEPETTTQAETNSFKEKLLNYLPTITDAVKLETDYNTAKKRKQYSELSELDKADIDKLYCELMNKFSAKITVQDILGKTEEVIPFEIPAEDTPEPIEYDEELKEFKILKTCPTLKKLNDYYKEYTSSPVYKQYSEGHKNTFENLYKEMKGKFNVKK